MRPHARGPRGPTDLFRGKPELCHRARQVEPWWRVSVEIAVPQPGAMRRVWNRRFTNERDVARPGRIPTAGADQDDRCGHLGERPHRVKTPGDQDFDGAGDDPGSRKTSFPGG